MTKRTKAALVGVLLLAWGVLVWFQLMSQPEPQRVPLVHKSASTQAASGPPPVVTRQKRADADSGFTTPKNIFAPLGGRPDMAAAKPAGPGQPRSLRAKKPGAPGAPSLPEEAAAPAAPPSPEELAMQAAHQQLAQYRFLGYLTQHGARRAFLAKGTDTYILRIGEMMEGRVLLTAMDATSVTLMETSTNVTAAVPLTQNTGTQTQTNTAPAMPPPATAPPQQEAPGSAVPPPPPPPPAENSPPPAPPMHTPPGAQIGFQSRSGN